MRRDKDGDTIGGCLVDHFPEVPSRHRIHTARRLVKKHYLGIMHHRYAESELLLPSERHVPNKGVTDILHRQSLQHLVCLLGDPLAVKPVDASEKLDVLPHLQVGIEGELLAHVADVPLDLLLLVDDAVPRDIALSGCRTAQSAENAHRRGLAGPVRTQKTEYLPLAHFKGDVIHRGEIPELFDQMGDTHSLYVLVHNVRQFRNIQNKLSVKLIIPHRRSLPRRKRKAG